MKHTLPNGLLITIEGIDGSGKSTLAKNLATLLQQEYQVILTKEPGGSALGKQLRTLLQTQPVPITPLAEFLLFAADRAQHFTEVIIPRLQQGNIVISDRMADSSIVYQGYGRGLDKEKIKQVNTWAMQERKPDITFYVRITPAEALQRINARNAQLTVFEKEHAEFTQKLADGFDNIYKNAPLLDEQKNHALKSNTYVLDGKHSPEILAQQAFNCIRSWITQ